MADEQELRELLREAAELIDSMATWFRNQPLGCPPYGTAQWQARARKALATGVKVHAAPERWGLGSEHAPGLLQPMPDGPWVYWDDVAHLFGVGVDRGGEQEKRK